MQEPQSLKRSRVFHLNLEACDRSLEKFQANSAQQISESHAGIVTAVK